MVGGVGYEVFLSASSLERMPPLGEEFIVLAIDRMIRRYCHKSLTPDSLVLRCQTNQLEAPRV